MSDSDVLIDGVAATTEDEIDLNSFLLDGQHMFPHVIVQLAYDPTELFMQADALAREAKDIDSEEQS